MNYREMKEELWKAFSKNLPIKVNVIENGRTIVKEISPDSNEYSDMYAKQSAYLNEKISTPSVDSIMGEINNSTSTQINNEVDKMMDEIHKASSINKPSSNRQMIQKESEEKAITNPAPIDNAKETQKEDKSKLGNIVIVKKDGQYYVIGDTSGEEIKDEGSLISKELRKLGVTKAVICKISPLNHNNSFRISPDIIFKIDDKGNIEVEGEYESIHYINKKDQNTNKKNQNTNKINIDSIIKNASMGHKIFLTAQLEKYGIDSIWDETLLKLDSKEMSLDEFKKFVEDINGIYDKNELIKYDIYNSNYKKIIKKYPIEDELPVKISSVIGYARNGFKKGIIAIISKYGIDNIWMDIADGLELKRITKEEYKDFVNNLKKLFSKEECEKYKIFTSKHFKALQEGKIIYENGSKELDILKEDKLDHKTAPSKAKQDDNSGNTTNKSQKVKKRKKASESLKIKFFERVNKAKDWWGGLSPKTKGIIAAATITIAGVGLLALNASAIKDILENINNLNNTTMPNIHANSSSVNPMIDSLKQFTEQAQNTFNNLQSTVQTNGVNWSSIGEGHIGYKTAADAINGTNGVTLSSYFGKEPSSEIVDVYNTLTGWMHLTKEQLNNPEVIKSLSEDPNNAIHIKDAWFNLADIAREVIKGGKVL